MKLDTSIFLSDSIGIPSTSLRPISTYYILKLYARIIYVGTTYKHFRKGRLLRESDKGGTIFLIPFLDKLEIIPPDEPSVEDTADYLEDNE